MMLEACQLDADDELTTDEEGILERDWTGLCYTAALRWAVDAEEQDWVVVHGSVLSELAGKRIDHVWCERGDFVVDLAMPVGSRIVARERYYRVVEPEVERVYSADKALLLAMKYRHDGPWNASEQLRK